MKNNILHEKKNAQERMQQAKKRDRARDVRTLAHSQSSTKTMTQDTIDKRGYKTKKTK